MSISEEERQKHKIQYSKFQRKFIQMSKLVQVENVYKSFGDVNAVNGVSLAIEEGQFYSLLGPSGCGKTTLLRLIAGFEQPTSGQIFIDNASMEGIEPNFRPTNGRNAQNRPPEKAARAHPSSDAPVRFSGRRKMLPQLGPDRWARFC